MVRPHLVKSRYYKTLGHWNVRQFYTIFCTKNIFSSWCYIEENFKNNEIYQKFFGEKAVRSPGKQGIVPLIHPMSYKPKIFTNVVLQCLVDKYMITYQNIWGEGMVRAHLVESSYCKILVPLKGISNLNHFLHSRNVF